MLPVPSSGLCTGMERKGQGRGSQGWGRGLETGGGQMRGREWQGSRGIFQQTQSGIYFLPGSEHTFCSLRSHPSLRHGACFLHPSIRSFTEQLITEGTAPGAGDLAAHRARIRHHRANMLEHRLARFSPGAKSASKLFCK